MDLKMSADFKAQLKLSDEFQCCYSLTLKKPLLFIYRSLSEHRYINSVSLQVLHFLDL